MPKPFVALDVDGTIFKSSLIEKVVDECIAAKVFDPDPFNEVSANRRRWQVDNNEEVYQTYLRNLVSAFVTQMSGVEVEEFNRVTTAMIEQHAVRKFAFPRRLIRALRDSHHPVAISGSPDILVEPFLQDLGIQTIYGSTYKVDDGKFTGEAASVGDKAAILNRLVAEGIVSRIGSIAVGDTVSDIPMLGYADTAIMFNASKTLTEHGKKFGWLRVNEVKDQITALQIDARTDTYIERDIEEIIN